MRLGKLDVSAGTNGVKRFGVWLPDGLHIWFGSRGVHLFWSGSPYQHRVTFDYDPPVSAREEKR